MLNANFLKQNAIWLVFIAEIIIFAIASDGTFITGRNIINISRQVSYYGIAAIGMTFVILIADIDLSIGSIITLVNVVCAWLMVAAGVNMWVAVFISLAMATAIGLLNAVMVAAIGIPALIATFASQTVFEGVAYLISGGRPIAGFDSAFGIFGRWSAFDILPICAILMIVCFALGSFILNKTYFGRYFYAIGGNEEAAELSGIRVNRVKYLIYAFSGFFAGYIGTIVWALLSGNFIPLHSPIADGITVGLSAFFPAFCHLKNGKIDLVELIEANKGAFIWKSLFLSVFFGILMILATSASLAYFAGLEYMWCVMWIGIADVVPIALTPFVVLLLAKRMKNIRNIIPYV